MFKNNLNDVKRELNNRLAQDKSILASWENVKINKKKNGEDYKVLSKAIEGARVCDYIELGNQIIVYGYGQDNRYYEDNILIYGYLDELPDTDERKKAYKRSFIRQKYQFTADEIKKAIENRIEWLRLDIANLERDIEEAETLYNAFHEKIKEAFAIFGTEKSVDKNGKTVNTTRAITYLIKETY